MTKQKLGGRFTFPGTNLSVNRMGYGAMQLAGPGVFGPPADRAACVKTARKAIEAGVDHIDTSDFYGPHVVNEILREALAPYPDDLVLVTKIGATRGPNGEWIHDHSRETLEGGVQDNLRNLGLDVLDIVNVRATGLDKPDANFDIRPAMEVAAEMQQRGLIKHIGVSNVNAKQIADAQAIAPIVCVQNMYNVALRGEDELVDSMAAQGIAWVPFFPLGGFSPLQSGELDAVAKELGATSMQVALAWLLHRSPNVLVIPGTKSVEHLEENLQAAEIELPEDALKRLDAIGAQAA